MSAPEVSVVIPTRNREMRLRFALEALAEQGVDRSRFEVIVVRADDQTEPPRPAPAGIELREITAPAGPAQQRNAGWRAARAPLIAFTDDDCRPLPGWLESLLVAAGPDPREVIQGRTEPDPDEAHLLHGRARSIDITSFDPWFPTCNIAYPRELLDRVGGFDETFPTSWGEDTDLGLRVVEAGARLRYLDDARAYHAVHARTLRQALREGWRRDSLPRVVARHPRQRGELFFHFFARRTHGELVAALAGLLVIRRHPLVGLIALYPYISNRRPPKRTVKDLPKILVRLPGRAAVDTAEVVAVGRSAIRHRVPML